MDNYTINDNILNDFNAKGKLIDWKGKKELSLKLSDSYKRLGEEFKSKSLRVHDCGSYLEFKKFSNNSLVLHSANFCKVRLCPMCAWRRSLKIFGQVSRVMDQIDTKDFGFLFLTLTVKNCSPESLKRTINDILSAFKKMTNRRRFKKSILGFFRGLEVTHNLEMNEFHPHIHCVLLVDKSYFKTSLYLKHDDWVDMWKSCLGVEYRPVVDIRKFRASNEKAIKKSVAEVAKYTVKPGDYIFKDLNVMDETVRILDIALFRKRLTAFGGIFKEIHRRLNLDDEQDGDLINTDINVDLRDDLDYIIVKYIWNVGYSQYTKVD